MKLFHFISEADSETDQYLKKYGLCSPRKLYHANLTLFMKYPFAIYGERAAKWLKIPKAQLLPQQVLDYLDRSPKRAPYLNSSSLFFSLLPLSDYHEDFKNNLREVLELEVDSAIFHVKHEPILLNRKDIHPTSWSIVGNERYLDTVREKAANKPIGSLLFRDVPHVAVNCYHILYKQLTILNEKLADKTDLSRNTTIEEDNDHLVEKPKNPQQAKTLIASGSTSAEALEKLYNKFK